MSRLWPWYWLRASLSRTRYSGRSRLKILPSHSLRLFSYGPLRLGLADRIRSILPADAIDHTSTEAEKTAPQANTTSMALLYEPDIARGCKLIQNGKISEACDQILATVPFDVVMEVLIERFIPSMQEGLQLGAYELASNLLLRGNRALGVQILHSLFADPDSSSAEIQCVLLLEGSVPGNFHAITKSMLGLNYPQFLSSSHVSKWLRVRTLACAARSADRQTLDTILQRYGKHVLNDDQSLRVFLRHAPEALRAASKHLIIGETENIPLRNQLLAAAVDAAQGPRDFQYLYRPFKKKLDAIIDRDTIKHLLRKAIQLDLSYEIATLCTMGGVHLGSSILSRAVLATAYDNHVEPGKTTDQLDSELVVGSPKLHQVERIWVALGSENKTTSLDAVFSLAVQKLISDPDTKCSRTAPARVLWSLLLSLPPDQKLSSFAQFQAATALIQRPYVEQLRYMALPQVSVKGIGKLLEMNVLRAMRSRRSLRISDSELQNEDDVRLIVGGIILASEKAASNIHEDGDLVKVITSLFKRWNSNEAFNVLGSLQKWFAPMPNVVFSVMGMLVRNGSFTLAIQFLHTINTQNIPQSALWKFLLTLTRNRPEIVTDVVTWLHEATDARVPLNVLRQIAVIICHSSQLTAEQIITNVQALRQLIDSVYQRRLGVRATTAYVDTLFHRAAGGDRIPIAQIYSALYIARKEGIPSNVHLSWQRQLLKMRAERNAHFTSRIGF